MEKISLQHKTKPKRGKGEMYWFQNEHIGLERTLFHRFNIPLIPIDSGLRYEPQPLDTEIVFEWLKLDLADPTDLEGLEWTSQPEDDTEVSIYIGSAHNPCDIRDMKFYKIDENTYRVDCSLFVDFEYEGVAQNEEFYFSTELILDTEIKE